jgi:hypothetical protein
MRRRIRTLMIMPGLAPCMIEAHNAEDGDAGLEHFG